MRRHLEALQSHTGPTSDGTGKEPLHRSGARPGPTPCLMQPVLWPEAQRAAGPGTTSKKRRYWRWVREKGEERRPEKGRKGSKSEVGSRGTGVGGLVAAGGPDSKALTLQTAGPVKASGGCEL